MNRYGRSPLLHIMAASIAATGTNERMVRNAARQQEREARLSLIVDCMGIGGLREWVQTEHGADWDAAYRAACEGNGPCDPSRVKPSQARPVLPPPPTGPNRATRRARKGK